MKTMKQIVISLVLGCVLKLANAYAHNLNSFEYNNYKSLFYNDQLYAIDGECTKAGLMCKSCTELVNCIQIEPGKFLEVLVKECDETKKEFCLMNQCSTSPNPQCAEEGASEFECHNTGIYPDPVDCRVYHMCVEERHRLETETEPKPTPEPTTPPATSPKPPLPATNPPPPKGALNIFEDDPDEVTHMGVKCEEGYGYNPVTTYCDKKLANGVCSGTPIPPCKELGQMGALANTSIFFVCMEDKNGNKVPNLFMCPAGTKFVNGTCS